MPGRWGVDDFRLRPLDPARDAEALHAVFGDEESSRYLSEPAAASVAETLARLEKWTAGTEDTSWTVEDAGNGDVLGRISFYGLAREKVMGAACMITPAGRGRRLAARALAVAIEDVFERKGVRRIVADIDPDNPASVRVFETLGFSFEGRLRGEWETHIGVRDSLIYGLLRDDPRPWKSQDCGA